jgi:hypothetical protein
LIYYSNPDSTDCSFGCQLHMSEGQSSNHQCMLFPTEIEPPSSIPRSSRESACCCLLPMPACLHAALPHAAALRALPLPAPVGTPPSGVAEVGVRRAARMSAPGGGNRRLARQVCVNQHVIQKID